MANKRFAKNPLLYIEQPTIQIPKAPMQHHYYTPKQANEVHEEKKNKPIQRQTRPLRRTDFFMEEELQEEGPEIEIEAEETSSEMATEKLTSENKFKDMTLPEKVNYFVQRPKHAPQIRCEVQTADKRYQGVIVGEEAEDVLMRIGRRSSSSKIPYADIKDIRMLGF